MLTVINMRFSQRGPVDLSVEAGRCAGITGVSGSGKTLFLRALCDLDPWSGKISLNGVQPPEIPAHEWRLRAGYLPAECQWWYDQVEPHFTGPPDDTLLGRLGFERDALEWEVARLSSGEKQRLGLARLLQREPDMLLLDEPTAHLDPQAKSDMEALLQDYRRERQVPVVWVSHEREQIERVADRIYLLSANGLAAEQTE
jgi:ABC-type multidrug transport system ATPase subunit